jgi:hypothetical protein
MANLALLSSPKLVDLVRSADPHGEMCVTILNDHSLALGTDPLKPSTVIDFSSEEVRSYTNSPTGSGMATAVESLSADPALRTGAMHAYQRTTRNLGIRWFELNGDRTECGSVKGLLLKGLRSIETQYQGTIEKLSHIKKRTKRIVARDRNDLFEDPKLVKKYSEPLLDAWWVGTNNSSAEVEAWLKQAVSMAGLQWGKDFRTSL